MKLPLDGYRETAGLLKGKKAFFKILVIRLEIDHLQTCQNNKFSLSWNQTHGS